MNLNYVIYFMQDLENTGKKRILFLTHKSWRTEKVIGKKSQSGPESSAFLYHVFTKKCLCKIINVMSRSAKMSGSKPIYKCYLEEYAYICGKSPQV